MIRIVLAVFSLAFVQVVRSQTAECIGAVTSVDDECIDLLATANPVACNDSCGSQLTVVQSACESSRSNLDINLIIASIETTCDSGAECTAALTAMNGDTDCLDAIYNHSTAVTCSGSCAALITDALDTCPNNAYVSSVRTGYNQDCGSGSVLQASGIITLLLLAVCALIA